MLFSEAISLYCDQRRADGFAANTVRNDARTLLRMLDILGEMPVDKLSPVHFDRIMQAEADRGLQPGSLNNYQSCMSAFARWCRDRGYMTMNQNPVGTRRYRKDPPKRKNYVPISDFPRLLDAAGETHYRDRAFIASGLYLMLRQSELTSLRVKDVDLGSGEVYAIIHKTQQADVMPICAELDTELRTYLTLYSQECGSLEPDWFLFPALGQTGFQTWGLDPTKRISKSEDITRRALAKIGFTDTRTGIHVLRRSAARGLYEELLDQGYDGAIRRVQAFLHHSSVTMSERYLGIELDREQRNKETRGQSLFPSLASDTVVNLREVGHG